MAIRFVDKPHERPPSGADKKGQESDAAADGTARFATPLEAVQPVNPNAAAELPFADLPPAEKAARAKKGRSPRK